MTFPPENLAAGHPNQGSLYKNTDPFFSYRSLNSDLHSEISGPGIAAAGDPGKAVMERGRAGEEHDPVSPRRRDYESIGNLRLRKTARSQQGIFAALLFSTQRCVRRSHGGRGGVAIRNHAAARSIISDHTGRSAHSWRCKSSIQM